MPERVRWLGAGLSGLAALAYLLFLLWSVRLVIMGEWQSRVQLPDAAWPVELVFVLVGAFITFLLVSALACAWCAAQWWMGHARSARIGSWLCLAVGVVLFSVSGSLSAFLIMPALTLLFWKRSRQA